MYLSPNETNLFECSIFYYFIWRHNDEVNKSMTDGVVVDEQQNDDTAIAFDTTISDNNNSPKMMRLNHHLHSNINKYKRIIEVMKEELPHVITAMSEETAATLSSQTIPEVYFRWMKYATIRNILTNTKIPRNNKTKKRKRDIADDDDDKSTKALKSALKDVSITPDDAKELLTKLRKEYSDAKHLAESLELKLSKSEKFNCELLKLQQEKLNLEKSLVNLVSEINQKTTADEQQKVDNDQQVINDDNNEAAVDDGKLDNLRTIFEKKKIKIELQESIYANAILYVVQETDKQEEQMETKNMKFESRLQQLVVFKQEFGHCEVSKEYNRSLHDWLKRYRQYFRSGNSKSRTLEGIAKLDALGLRWEPIRLAKAFTSIPGTTLENAKKVLFTLRKEHTEAKKITDSLESKLTKSEKIYSDLLKFNNKKLRLEKRITNLDSEAATTTTEQKLDNDQNDVNATEVIVEGDQLNNVRAKLETKKRKLQLQETMYANAILNEVRHDGKEQKKVDKNGKKYIDFKTRLQELFEFKQKFGHCQVDRKDHGSLYYWLMQMRQFYHQKNRKLSQERIAKLDALGVVWDVVHNHKQRTFDEYLQQCIDFQEKHGHLRIPLVTERNNDGTELSEHDINFRIWAQSMRQRYHKKIVIGSKAKLDKRSIALLDTLGFQWNIDATSSVEGGSNIDVDENNMTPGEIMYRTRIEQLRKVKDIYGNCNIKKNILSVFPNNYTLIKWMSEQRINMKLWLAGKNTRLTEERQEMLRSIEFDFNPNAHYNNNKKTWQEKTETLALTVQEKKTNNNNHHEDSENINSENDHIDINE